MTQRATTQPSGRIELTQRSDLDPAPTTDGMVPPGGVVKGQAP